METKNNFSGEYFKNTLLAIIETASFLKRGPNRFGGSLPDALMSFLALAFILPVNLYILFLLRAETPELLEIPYWLLAARYLTATMYCLLFVWLMVLMFCKAQNKTHLFRRFVCGFNWMSIAPTTIFLFPLLLVALGFHTIMEVQNFAMIVSLYETILTAFFITHIFKTNWFAAGFLALMIYIMQNIAITAVLIP